MTSLSVGVYEKALPAGPWPKMLDDAAAAGFHFVEMSLDESPARLRRLAWTASERRDLVAAGVATGCPVRSLTLSAHRTHPLGHPDPDARAYSLELLVDAVRLATDLGAAVLQVAGYVVYDQPRLPDARRWFVDGLRHGAELAAELDVVLGLENVDGRDVLGMDDALGVIEEVGSDRLRPYPDVGNLAANERHVIGELRSGLDLAVGLHLKDARPGEFRRVPFGEGTVPFGAIFDLLFERTTSLPLVIEMWNDDGDPLLAARALEWVSDRMDDAGGVRER